MALIGISGKINSGKDLIGRIIQGLTATNITEGEIIEIAEERLINFNSTWKVRKFADKLKDIICLLIGCTRQQLEDRTFKETLLGEEWRVQYYNTDHGRVLCNVLSVADNLYKQEVLTPRLLLQLLGTQCGREIIHPDIWVNALMADYKDYKFNQAELLAGALQAGLNSNWIITDVRFPNEVKAIKNRDGIVVRVDRPIAGILSNHESETSLDNYKDFDHYIVNGGTIEDLIQKVRSILIFQKIIS